MLAVAMTSCSKKDAQLHTLEAVAAVLEVF
jgi:hypothetical protein